MLISPDCGVAIAGRLFTVATPRLQLRVGNRLRCWKTESGSAHPPMSRQRHAGLLLSVAGIRLANQL